MRRGEEKDIAGWGQAAGKQQPPPTHNITHPSPFSSIARERGGGGAEGSYNTMAPPSTSHGGP